MWFFTLLAGVALLVLNTKLVHIVRYVTRGGQVHRLRPGIFWLNRYFSCIPPAASCRIIDHPLIIPHQSYWRG